jgi:hypothetical protein
MKKISLGAFAILGSLAAAAAFAGIQIEPPVVVSEPGTLALLALGIAGVVAARLRGRK